MNLVIKNGTIIDEKGRIRIADIGIAGSKIISIGKVKTESDILIDATGLFVVPGFIDIHSHNDFVITKKTPFLAKVSQGITTEVIGNCGISGAPYTERTLPFIKEWFSLIGRKGMCSHWFTWKRYLEVLQISSLTTNIAPLVGHNNLKVMAEGSSNQMKEMKNALYSIMEQGCFGLSTGLIYTPGVFSKTEEIIELAKVVSKFGGIYATHIRGEEGKIIQSIREGIEIGKSANTSVEISHMKVSGEENWNKTEDIISIITKKRKAGMNINYDVYPYTASSTTITVLLPLWIREGGQGKILKRLKDISLRKRAEEEMSSVMKNRWNKIIINQVNSSNNRWMEGYSIKEIAEKLSVSPARFLMDIILQEKGMASIVRFTMSEDSVKTFLKAPMSFIGTDGLPGRRPHPRLWGSFPRVIRRYVREENLLTLKEAIYKMSTGPAEKLGLEKRGTIKTGNFADIVIFDLNKIKDCATYKEPTLPAEGIKAVIVNGKLVMLDGKFTGATPGMVLLHKAL
ncbi:MAG: D-aminoacylase [Candidatus Ratteibacteria bacterium]|nr:D-aminoacylase [Candidatus Ratteibacteria bacterium]